MIQEIKTIEDVKQFAKDLLTEGCCFHCDDDFNDYTYAPEEAELRNALMSQCFDVCETANEDIYEIMLMKELRNPVKE